MIDPRFGMARTGIVPLGEAVVPRYRERLWWYQRQIADALEGVLRYVRFRGKRGGYKYVVISMPPRHGKSLHGTELLPAYALGVDADLKIMVATNGGSLSKIGVTNTKQWMATEAYQRAFATRTGNVESFDRRTGEKLKVVQAEDAAYKFETVRPVRLGSKEMTTGGGYYMSQGIGGSLTGKGFDIGILDDPIKNAEQALSETYHSKVWAFYTSTFNTRADHEFAAQFYIGTRWTAPDFADELTDFWRSQTVGRHEVPIKEIRFPALAEDPLEPDDPRDEAFIAENGAGLDRADFRSQEWYEGQRNAIMTKTPWVWFGMYQQRPKMAGTKFFQPHQWHTYDESFHLNRLDFVDFSIDANLSATGPSYAVILVTGVLIAGEDAGKDVGEHYFLLDEARGHWSYDELEAEFLRLRRKWEIALPKQASMGKVWVENKALGPTLLQKFRGGRYPLVAVPKMKSKIYCYRVASPVVEQMRVRLPIGTWGEDPTWPGLPLITDEWLGAKFVPTSRDGFVITDDGGWVKELSSHPSKPDDRRDALAQQVICRTSYLGVHLLGVGSASGS